jgi:hypothetical protein
MATKRFKARLEARGSGALVEVPFDVGEAFGAKRPPVRATINGVTFRSTVAVYGGRYYIGMRRELRDRADVSVGDTVSVEITRDREPRDVEVPDDLALALQKRRDAQRAFEELSFTHRKEWVQWITEAKKDETRRRRIDRTVEMLQGGTKHP